VGAKNLPLDTGKQITKVLLNSSIGKPCTQESLCLVASRQAATLLISIPDHKEVDRRLLNADLGKPESQRKSSTRLIGNSNKGLALALVHGMIPLPLDPRSRSFGMASETDCHIRTASTDFIASTMFWAASSLVFPETCNG